MKKYFVYIISCIVLLYVPITSFAATVFLNTPKNSYAVGQEFMIHVYLDTDQQRINTVSGELTISETHLEVLNVSTGNSGILFWIDTPQVVSETNTITFSGITPGGVFGSSVLLFSVRVRAVQAGVSTFDFISLDALLHDGQGTSVDVDYGIKNIQIFENNNQAVFVEEILDLEPPEDFLPTVVQDPNLYNGMFVLIFATQDKLSGIQSYEVREGLFGRFTPAESPYVLQDQTRSKKIYIRAIDMQGNVRLVQVPAVNRQLFPYGILVVSIIVFFSILFFAKKKKIEIPYYDNEV